VNISQPDTLLSWLEKNDAVRITNLLAFLDGNHGVTPAKSLDMRLQITTSDYLLGLGVAISYRLRKRFMLCRRTDAGEGNEDNNDERLYTALA
jgi:hypothetical protein